MLLTGVLRPSQMRHCFEHSVNAVNTCHALCTWSFYATLASHSGGLTTAADACEAHAIAQNLTPLFRFSE